MPKSVIIFVMILVIFSMWFHYEVGNIGWFVFSAISLYHLLVCFVHESILSSMEKKSTSNDIEE